MLPSLRALKNNLKTIPRKDFLKIAAATATLIISTLYLVASLAALDLKEKIELSGDIEPYVRAEASPSNLPSRQWIAYSIRLAKGKNLSTLTSAHLHSLVATVYADILEKTDSEAEASVATAKLINTLFPENSDETNGVIAIKSDLSTTAQDHLSDFLNRNLQNIKKLLEVDKRLDAATIKSLDTWHVDRNKLRIPPPLENGNIGEWVENRKVIYAATQRTPEKDEIVFFWDGIDNFLVNQGDNITPVGVWLNIFHIESKNLSDNKNYAKNLKILTQGMRDALTIVWQEKFIYSGYYSSNSFSNLSPLVRYSLYPRYPSEHAAVSFAAASILEKLIPEKKELWAMHAKNAAYSRLLAGVQSDRDIEAGKYIGVGTGAETLKSYSKERNNKEESRVIFGNCGVTCQVATILFIGFDSINESLKKVWKIAESVSKSGQYSFQEAAKEVGLEEKITSEDKYEGVSWADFDSDGNIDILINNQLYKNTGDGKFVFKRQFPDWGVFGDYNNDGCPDLYVTKTGAPQPSDPTELSDYLFKNNCDGSFTDVSKKAGVSDVYHGNSVSWVDYNNDGYLDIYVSNWGLTPQENWFYESGNKGQTYVMEPNILYKNRGDGTFTNVTSEAGIEGLLLCYDQDKIRRALEMKLKPTFQSVWFDFDNDRKSDLLSVTDSLISPFYRNLGNGKFSQITESANLCTDTHWNNMGASVGDTNNDGFLDFYVTNAGHNFLWQNNGDGTFRETANQSGAQDYGYGWGTEMLDYNNDGFIDIAVINGHNRLRSALYTVPSGIKNNDLDELFKNKGDGTFQKVGKEVGFSISNEIKYSVAAADYNNDGAVDLFIPASPRRYRSSHPLLFKNKGKGNNWITIQLVGVQNNRDGIGSRIEITTGGKKQIREVQAGSSYRAQSSSWSTFGLGKDKKIDSITVRWPKGNVQTLNDIEPNKMIIIKEGNDSFIESRDYYPSLKGNLGF